MRHRLVQLGIAFVWLVNGLIAKVLGLVPRHEAIVARLLGDSWAREITVAIGLAEIAMCVWVLSGLFRRFNAVLQIALVLTMNLLESVLAPELLLWGRWNIVFALGFCGVVYFHGFRRDRGS